MEFFFKPRDIERHMDFALNGMTMNNISNNSSQHCDVDAVMEMDVDMIPDADDLMDILMT